MKILHISDTHAEGETMLQLESLTRSLSGVDVVACTGDCVSSYTSEVSKTWNEWPQQLKLIVPGNHLGGDTPETFVHLTNWTTDVPWYRRHGDISFIGLHYAWAFREQLERIAPQFEQCSEAVVVLTHEWPCETNATALAEKLKKFFPKRPVLYLHGHDHRLKTYWDPKAKLAELICCRSKIISCDSGNRGCAHLITWDGHKFSYEFKDGYSPLKRILVQL